MDIALWIVQILLAVIFLLTGFMKLSRSKEAVVAGGMHAMESYTPSSIRLIGLLEILGALGLILPSLTGILPWLTPLAAIGLALTMVGALITHASRREYPNMIVNLILLSLALFVAYGRLFLVPIV